MMDFGLVYDHVMAAVKKCFMVLVCCEFRRICMDTRVVSRDVRIMKVVLGMLLLVIRFRCSRAHMQA